MQFIEVHIFGWFNNIIPFCSFIWEEEDTEGGH